MALDGKRVVETKRVYVDAGVLNPSSPTSEGAISTAGFDVEYECWESDSGERSLYNIMKVDLILSEYQAMLQGSDKSLDVTDFVDKVRLLTMIGKGEEEST